MPIFLSKSHFFKQKNAFNYPQLLEPTRNASSKCIKTSIFVDFSNWFKERVALEIAVKIAIDKKNLTPTVI